MRRTRATSTLAGLAAVAGLLFASAATCDAQQANDLAAVTCPTGPTPGWVPDVVHPVSYGAQETGPADGAPHQMQIYYPTDVLADTDQPTPISPPIAKRCLVQWPVVIFLHGSWPTESSGQPKPADYYRQWADLLVPLARSGYVVVVPDWSGAYLPADADLAAARADLDWVRNQWSNASSVSKTRAAAMGHSRGAVLAGMLAMADPSIGAYISLAGVHSEVSPTVPWFEELNALQLPSFYSWGANDTLNVLDGSNLGDGAHEWDDFTAPVKYGFSFTGDHFEYLPGAPDRACPQILGVTADLIALFVAGNVPVLVNPLVPADLRIPQVQLSAEQTPYANDHLRAIVRYASGERCNAWLEWRVDDATGARRIP